MAIRPELTVNRSNSHQRSGPLVGAALATVVALGACSLFGDSASPAIVVRDSAGIPIAENDLARLTAVCALDPKPTVSIGTDSGAPEYQLHRVRGATRLGDDRIVLVNEGSQEIRFYDQSGRFLSRAGRAGQGPGEFQSAFFLWAMPGDTIWVGDYDPWEFEVFAPDGRWIRAVRPNPQYANSPTPMIVLGDGRAVLGERLYLPPSSKFEPRQLTIVLHGPDGKLLDTVGTYPDGRQGTIGPDLSFRLYPFFESFAQSAGSGSRFMIGHGSEPQLSVYTATDTAVLERIVRWTSPERTISNNDLAAERRRLTEESSGFDAQMRRRVLDPMISEERPVAERFPAFTGVVAGRDGRIWIREYPRPAMPDSRRMIAFDADGRFVCRATLPPFDDLLEVGDDYLLAMDRDSLGVERVLQFALRPPAPTE